MSKSSGSFSRNLIAMVSLVGMCFACTPADTPVPTAEPTATVAPTATKAPTPTAAPTAVLTKPAAEPAPALTVKLTNPTGLAFDADGNLYISLCETAAQFGAHQIVKVDQGGMLTLIAGERVFSYDGDGGPAAKARFSCPQGMSFDSAGNLYVADHGGHRIRQIGLDGNINAAVGSGSSNLYEGTFGGDGGPALEANLNRPHDVILDADGNMYIADLFNNRVRRVEAEGIITTVAGNGQAGYTGDGGPATDAQLHTAEDFNAMFVAVDAAGNLYVSIGLDSVVRKVDPSGIISTVAGTGEAGFSGDGGPATAAQLDQPTGLAVDTAGNLYIADSHGNVVRRVGVDGTITTVAGTGEDGFSGDGGPATEAQLYLPQTIKFDAAGNLYIADNGNDRVRMIDQNGIITTVAGGG